MGTEDRDFNTAAIPVNSSAQMPLKFKAIKIAPDSSGGIVSFIHPCINSAAWVRDNDCRSNNCLSKLDQIVESIVLVFYDVKCDFIRFRGLDPRLL